MTITPDYRSLATKALADAAPDVLWFDDPDRPERLGALVGTEHTDLAVVGGGYSGLWTALLAKRRNPDTDVILVESTDVAGAASGRNGGFASDSLTHGYSNGLSRFPREIDTLTQLGQDNLAALVADLGHLDIDCDFEWTGQLDIAVDDWQVDGLAEEFDRFVESGGDAEFFDRDQLQAEIHSPTYRAGLWDKKGAAVLNPARLAWGLRRACLDAGVRIYEHSHVTDLVNRDGGITLTTTYGTIRAKHTVLATNVFPSLIRRARAYTVPVYDYVLATEPLTAEQLDRIGWHRRQGLADAGNQFHYYRLTADNRIVWGGYDAIYHFGKRVSSDHNHRPQTYRTLAEHFFATFPQLTDVRFTHRWGGAIDTCSRFSVFFGTAMDGNVAYSAGYTGLGVAATRFGAEVTLDLLAGEETERTRLKMVRTKPIPFPPEPLAYIGVQATRWSMARADGNEGRRNLWLKAMDAVGLGFDS
ncbi:NAD(P)/FAD-dependent oxidoreductase [Rhodococcus sp. NPDC056960]|uniref:NAD(P)/FAD-dependent oxidoreductase n=1 Tax=Rhodococcus sp. NPDC056960 TaxID=3345982 RepID=UPI003644C98E